MNINYLAWLTDVHLNFLDTDGRNKFYQQIERLVCDAILITGDIAEAPSVCNILNEFSKHIKKKIYFVLGNHDYYFSDLESVRKNIRALCAKNHNVIWLGEPVIIQLNKNTLLIGQDGWADARYGDYDNSSVTLNDSRLIAELSHASINDPLGLKNAMQQLADADAKTLAETLAETRKKNIKKLIIATHIPPFAECCLYEGRPSDENWLPFFSSKATGDVIAHFAQQNPQIDILVLCGHTHSNATFKPYPNLEVKSGGAHYHQPQLQEIIYSNI